MQFTSTHNKEEVMFKSAATSLYVKAVTVTASLVAIAALAGSAKVKF